ncbi:hypothetical protein F2Q69_00039538 [Brassica cretica]|uniref:Uncharacterized protein n=1 Tax=Brassica cretica TaxID=69181 RepID=A0A8S9NG41_BRACR|nr:hypothetical protein F2Q69_00039538 [Brassica cretica]
MGTVSYATNESRDNICNLMELINLITYCCLFFLHVYKTGQALNIWARGPTRIPAAIVWVGIGHRVQGPRPAAVRSAKTQLKMVPQRDGTNGLRVNPIAISS